MKTVTIPTCANPFVVIVNGIKYTYPAGATMEVPDDVAEVIEQHEEAKTEPAPVAPPFVAVPSSGESGGGASGEVFDLSGVFNLYESVQAGGAVCHTNHDNTAIIEACKKGTIKLKVLVGPKTYEVFANPVLDSNNATIAVLLYNAGNAMFIDLIFTPTQIAYMVQGVPITPIPVG